MVRILYNYIAKSVLVNFFLGLVIFTVFFFTGDIVRIVNLILKGIPLTKIGSLFICLVPYLLSICLPMAFLTSIILVFGRFSQDNEITAMRSCGISVYQISFPVIVIALILSFCSIYLNDSLIPASHFKARKILYSIGFNQPTALLEPGEFVETFPNNIIYIKEKNGNVIKQVIVYQTQEDNQIRTIQAKKGEISFNKETKQVILTLHDGQINQPSDKEMEKIFNLKFGTYTIALDSSQLFQNPDEIGKKHKDMTIAELREKIHEYKQKGLIWTPFSTEIHKKLSLSFSCLAFALIGIALGIKTHRSEKTIGAGISLLLILFYYMFIAFGKAFDEKPQYFPDLIMWLPNILLGLIGIFLLHRIARK